MSNWRNDLKRVIEEEAQSPPEQSHETIERARRDISRFISHVAMPAFEALQDELKYYGRQCEIDRRDYQIALTVYHDDREEFSYVVRGRTFHRMFFAFPELGDPGREGQLGRAEVTLNRDSERGTDVNDITRETIIRDFIAEYARWLGNRD